MGFTAKTQKKPLGWGKRAGSDEKFVYEKRRDASASCMLG